MLSLIQYLKSIGKILKIGYVYMISS